MNNKELFSVQDINKIFENKGLNFTFEQLLESDDNDTDWWINLSHDWKVIVVYNHHREYSRSGVSKIDDFDSIINTINEYDKVQLGNFLVECKLLTSFHCSCYNTYYIKDLSPVYFLENLERLYCHDLQINNAQSISSLKKLKFIDFRRSNLNSLEMLADLQGLEDLYVEQTEIKSLKGIENLTNLKKINFSITSVNSLEYLKDSIKLEYLSCFQTCIQDLEPLRNLQNLKTIFLYSTRINNLNVFEQFRNIDNINVSNTEVVDLLSLRNSTNLYKITIKGTAVPPENSDILKALIPNVEIDRGEVKTKGWTRTFRQTR